MKPPVSPTTDPRVSPLDSANGDTPPPLSTLLQRVYVSYAWGLDNTPKGARREAVVDDLCQTLPRFGWEVIRDRQAMRNGDSIHDFILRIGRSERVIVVLSDAYLRSAFCVNELHHVYQHSCGQHGDFARRIVPVTLGDARFSNWEERAAWAKHWEAQHLKMEENLKYLSVRDFREYQMCKDWSTDIGNMLAFIADTLHPVGFEAITADDFRAIREMLDRDGDAP